MYLVDITSLRSEQMSVSAILVRCEASVQIFRYRSLPVQQCLPSSLTQRRLLKVTIN